jgi:hypothetical protein
MNIFKIEYHWPEDEYDMTLLGKEVEQGEFEKDLIKAKKFAESLIGKKVEGDEYLGKGYIVDCLPEYYRQIIWFLMDKLNYVECNFDKSICYYIDDYPNKKIKITKSKEKVEQNELKD